MFKKEGGGKIYAAFFGCCWIQQSCLLSCFRLGQFLASKSSGLGVSAVFMVVVLVGGFFFPLITTVTYSMYKSRRPGLLGFGVY